MPNTPAAQVDLQVGDKIVAVDGNTSTNMEKAELYTGQSRGRDRSGSINVERAGTEKQFNLPIKDFLKDQNPVTFGCIGLLIVQ